MATPYASPFGRGADVRGGEGCFCEHISLNIVHYAAFFAKKDGTKKASRGSVAAPGTYPAYDVPVIRAAVCDFLPLRLFDEMRIGGK